LQLKLSIDDGDVTVGLDAQIKCTFIGFFIDLAAVSTEHAATEIAVVVSTATWVSTITIVADY